MTVQEAVTKLRAAAGYAVAGKDDELYLFRTFHKDGSVNYPGLKFVQSVHAPEDGMLIHPTVLNEFLQHTSSGNIIDIVKHSYSPR